MNDQDSMFKAAQAGESASTPSAQGDRRHEATASVTGTAAFAVPSIAAAWDPYEVWLTRVKRPRDLRVGPSQA